MKGRVARFASEFPHLPPGREPGPQTLRTRRRRAALTPLVAVVGLAMFAAGVWVAAGGRGGRFDRQEELWGGLLFAAFGLVALYVVGIHWAPRGRAPRLRGFALSVAAEGIRRGDDVSAVVTRTSGGTDGVELGLVCDERADTEIWMRGGVRVRETKEATVVEEWQPVAAGAGEHTATFRVPADAPYSYEGDCVSFAWRVSVRRVRPGRSDPRLDEPIWVDP